MDSVLSPAENSVDYLPDTVVRTVKILVAGSFGVGKTTFVSSVSEIKPLRTEETITETSIGVDSLAGIPNKVTTTVAMDFGRITLNSTLALYLFGTPGQRRFLPFWRELARGALGALVLVDPRRLDQADEALTLIEERGLPYAVAVNEFDGTPRYPHPELREALDLAPTTPLTSLDARIQHTCVPALITLVEFLHRSRLESRA
jgi:signal recognition particle receptor subunit beta